MFINYLSFSNGHTLSGVHTGHTFLGGPKKGPKCPKTPKNGQNRQNRRKPTVSSGFGEIAKNGKIELGLLWGQNPQKPQKSHFLRGPAGPPKKSILDASRPRPDLFRTLLDPSKISFSKLLLTHPIALIIILAKMNATYGKLYY